MKKSLGLFAVALLLALPAAAGAQTDGFYVTPKIGFSYFRGDNEVNINGQTYGDRGGKSAFAGALAVGYGFSGQGAPVRLELEYAHRSSVETETAFSFGGFNFINQQKLGIGTLMGNAYLDFENDSAVTPYIGAGLGVAFIHAEDAITRQAQPGWAQISGTTNDSERKFTWDLTAGAALALSDNLALDLGYRYFHIGNVNMGNFGGVSFDSNRTALHEAMLGLRFTYN